MAVKTIKVTISTPPQERSANDECAARHGMNRSEFYTAAAAAYRASLDDDAEVDRLNRILDGAGQPDTGHVRATARAILAEVEW